MDSSNDDEQTRFWGDENVGVTKGPGSMAWNDDQTHLSGISHEIMVLLYHRDGSRKFRWGGV